MQLLKRTKHVLIPLLVTLAMLNMTGCAGLQKKVEKPPSEVALCPSTAFVDAKTYTLTELKSKEDKQFHLWAAENLAKNPVLIDAYKNLFECWTTYHGKPKL